ncbi:hypothetical protein [Flavobacterium sp.]|uniref:hypothetical protein n=1 Tax=Flavobacterium sp. TaxID=239 RepID=UPI00391A5E01
MKKITIGFCLFFCAVSLAQEKKVHLISLANEKNTALESDFYIEKIYDGRQVKENIGTVYVSLFNNKVAANFEKPFTEELSSLLAILYPKTENKRAISIRINELYVTESNADTDNNYKKKQTGSATVVLDIIEKKDDGLHYITGTFFSSKEDSRSDVTKKHAQLITLAIKNSFENYKNTQDTYKIAIPFVSDETINLDDTDAKIKAGIYLNYKDVFNGKLLSLEDYTITKYKEGFCLLSNATGRVENGFYGFSDGNNFYINLFQFSTVKYYLKTEILGVNYFIDEVEERNLDFNSFYLAYGGMVAMGGGLLPALIFSGSGSSEPQKIPLLIERANGMPTFLTDKYVMNMLESNAVLLKEYKKTKRTPADKKMIYKKFYNF